MNNDITNLETYSTNEVAIGKWVDSKTIYKKTYVVFNDEVATFNQETSGSFTFWSAGKTYSSQSIDTIVHSFGVIKHITSSNNKIKYGSSGVSTVNFMVTMYCPGIQLSTRMYDNDLQIYLTYYNGYFLDKSKKFTLIVTIEYTKSS